MSVRATQTKSFVVSYFYPANYYGEDTCPDGLNPLPDVFFKRDLKILGLPQAEVNAMFDKDYKIQNGEPTTRWVAVVATRGNGRDCVYLLANSVLDVLLYPGMGRRVWVQSGWQGGGFTEFVPGPRLTRRASTTSSSADRFISLQGLSAAAAPLGLSTAGTCRVRSGPVISVVAESLKKNGDVTVRFETSLDQLIVQDANAHVQSDMTYRVASHQASLNVVHGKIRNGVIYTEPARIRMRCNSYIQPVYEFLEARMRLRMKPKPGSRACWVATSRGTTSTGPPRSVTSTRLRHRRARSYKRCAATPMPIPTHARV